ncbi:Daunorubicin resistance transmembrane protein [Streptococcus thermophilus]|nr:Daunorubicin resistance transmembrane protein [Streptococcus thermophilus]CAD0150377.1 Daunorubicin resistance transmembrane protein [Streptococcus thermophilus]
MSGSLIPLAFFPKVVSAILSLLPFSSLIYTPVMIIVGKYDASQMLQFFWLLVMVGLVSVDLETSPVIYHHSRRLV